MSADAPLPFYLSGHGIIRCDLSPSLDNVRLFDQGFSRNFFCEMTKLLQDGRFTDVTLKAGNKELKCHRCVLSAASPYFAAMFSSGMDECTADVVEIHGTDPVTMEIIIKYMYSSKIELDTNNVQNLVQACDLFQFEGLKYACEKFLFDQMDTTNCIGFYKFAKLYSLNKLRDGALSLMMSKFKEVVHGPEFKQLSAEDLIEYISYDELQVPCEDPVFDSVLQWLTTETEVRKDVFEKIVEHIRLPYCSSAYLCHVVQQHDRMSSEMCKNLVKEARDFQLQPEHQLQMISSRTTPRQSFSSVNSLVLVGGLNHENHKNKHCWYLTQNAAGDSYDWQLLAQLPCPKSSFYSICVANNGIMLTGGYHSNVKHECWLFDIREKKWKPLPSMLKARCKHTSLVHGDFVYVIGGEDDQDQPLSSVERFDMKSFKWETLPPMEDALTDPPAAAHGQYIYVMGGLLGTESQVRTTSAKVQIYDTVWEEWHSGPEMPSPCRLGTAAVVNDKIYIMGGYTQSCMSFDPLEKKWEILTPPKQKHGNAAAVVWQNNILLAGGDGDSNQTTSVIEVYDPRKDNWSFSNLSLKEELACHFLLSVNLCSL